LAPYEVAVDLDDAKTILAALALPAVAPGVTWTRAQQIAFARAYDTEDAAQRGEPTPWQIERSNGRLRPVFTGEWVEERLACVGAGLAALPAVSPGVSIKPLVWVDFEGKGAKAQAWNEANYMIQLWSDGRYEISASYPGYSTFIHGTDRWYPTLEAAKAAAQADYERRIRAALDTPAPALMDELVEALRGLMQPGMSGAQQLAAHHAARAVLAKIGGQ
jgi:hypothetical protein